jgi:hypothetical protein
MRSSKAYCLQLSKLFCRRDGFVYPAHFACHAGGTSIVLSVKRESAMRKVLAWLVGLLLAANGLFMLGDPPAWYDAVPGVAMTGPLNPHFVRDIGCAYLTAGAALIWFAVDARAHWAAFAGGVFLALHALVHLTDAASGRETAHGLLSDLLPVFAPPAVALWLAWPRPMFEKERQHVEMADPAASRRF